MTETLAQFGERTAPARHLPEPTGYRLLIALPKAEETSSGGIVLTQSTREREEAGSIVGEVIKMGPDAYVDDEKFPEGPYCKVNDWIIMRAYSGTRFEIDGEEYRLINDTSVEAVIDNPRGIKKL